MNKFILIPIVIIAFILNACDSSVKNQLPYLGPHIIDGDDTTYHVIPEFSFVNQNGKIITEKDFNNKVYVADFFFISCPTICPVMTKNLKKVYDKYSTKEDFAILSHSIDTKHDTVSRLKAYADRLGVDAPIWNFITGDRDEIYNIGEDFYMASAAEDAEAPGGYIHSGMFILIDKNKRIRGVYDGTNDNDVAKLIVDLKQLLN